MMNGREALEASYKKIKSMEGGEVLEHPNFRQMVSQMMRVLSDARADVSSWDDVQQVALEASSIMAGDHTEMQEHFHAALKSVVDYAQTLAPTYINPPPFE